MAINQYQLEKQGIYEAKASLTSFLNDLSQIEKLSEVAAAKAKKRAKLGGFMMLGGLIATFAGFAYAPLAILGILDIIGGLIVWITSFFMGGKVAEHPVRLGVAKRRIGMILEDANPNAPFSCRLALSSNPRELSIGAWKGRAGGTQSLEEDSWLTLEGPLLDGTVVTDEIKDLTRTRSRSNPRGKRKSKTRRTTVVNVRFSYNKEVYGDARAAAQALHNEVKVGNSAQLRGVRVTEKAIALKALVTSENDIIPTVGMLSVGGYRILNLARRLAAAQRGKTQ